MFIVLDVNRIIRDISISFNTKRDEVNLDCLVVKEEISEDSIVSGDEKRQIFGNDLKSVSLTSNDEEEK